MSASARNTTPSSAPRGAAQERGEEPSQVKVHLKNGNMEYESTYGDDPRGIPPSIDPSHGFMQAPLIGGLSLDPKYGFNHPTPWTPPSIYPSQSDGLHSIGSTPMPGNPSSSNVGTIGGTALTNFGLQGPVAPPLSSSSLSSHGISGIGMSGLSPGGFGQFGASPIGGGSWSSNNSGGSTSSSTSSSSSSD